MHIKQLLLKTLLTIDYRKLFQNNGRFNKLSTIWQYRVILSAICYLEAKVFRT